MAQIPQNGLFEPVLPQYNAGSRNVLAEKSSQNLRVKPIKLNELDLLNLGLF